MNQSETGRNRTKEGKERIPSDESLLQEAFGTLTEDLLVSLRRIVRAISLHSRRLGKDTGLSTPQLVLLRDLERQESSSVSDIARRISLSQATVTTLLQRLEASELVRKKKSRTDKRRTDVTLSAKGRKLLKSAPPALQDTFLERFAKLEHWEQLSLVAGLSRVALMMDAEASDDQQGKVPMLTTEEV